MKGKASILIISIFRRTEAKLLGLSILPFVLISSCLSPTNSFYTYYDRGDCLTTRFDDVADELDITLRWKNDSLYLYWDQYKADEFSGYYVVRKEGSGQTCPYYYKGGSYYEYIGRKSRTYFRDTDTESGQEYYYRVCVRESDNEVDCGSVIKVYIK